MFLVFFKSWKAQPLTFNGVKCIPCDMIYSVMTQPLNVKLAEAHSFVVSDGAKIA